MSYRIALTETAVSALESIKNPITRERIVEKIDLLAEHPALGKPLRGPLSGYRSVRAARNRYRIIYRVEEKKEVVLVVAVGIRKGKDRDDIYRELRRFIRRAGPSDED